MKGGIWVESDEGKRLLSFLQFQK